MTAERRAAAVPDRVVDARPDPLDAIAFAIRRAIARRAAEDAERRRSMTVIESTRRDGEP